MISDSNMPSKGLRIHIGIFGDTNAGKSTLLNLLTGQGTSLVSAQPGTTTDPVYKAMEVKGVGPVTFIDTAGYSDVSELGALRMNRTEKVLEECDILIYVERFEVNEALLKFLTASKKPLIKVKNGAQKAAYVPFDKGHVLAALQTAAKHLVKERPLFDGLLRGEETVVLVMPQDIAAPTGRLILPQVQTTRALLDLNCTVISTKPEQLQKTLEGLRTPPDLVVTDSQAFHEVYPRIGEIPITSFSILMARAKGDIETLVAGARVLDTLDADSKVLIAEACTHAPLEEDIGRVKIPKLLRARYGDMTIDFSRGLDFPEPLDYDVVIMCGSCMFNRARVLYRMEQAAKKGIPVTNYGLVLSHLHGILDKVIY
ncbi:50S ribosome-binding GTPase [Peptoniphilus equinus]|uniref:50S ribosome-binding GTPase n=1 Tax=Peptoniphilus equinus TaxID=3016343 RepID=A0ABY7QQZ1_9FIRM|nr:GTPase [Peptoniphilus equinus]WBW49220.1 50S ribosome-binding GTPase [Peptoniphilus equinus]